MKNYSEKFLQVEIIKCSELEKKYTLKLLELLDEIDRRGLHLKWAYSSLFDYLVRGLKYSETEATYRVNAVRLIRDIPQARIKLEKRDLSLTTASKIQQFFKTMKKIKQPLKSAEKLKFIEAATNKSKRDVEKMIAKELPIQHSRDCERRISEELSEIKFVVDNETLELIEKYKQFKGNQQMGQIFKTLLQKKIQSEEKKRFAEVKETKQNPEKRFPTSTVKRKVYQRSKGHCEYKNPITGQQCESLYCLEIDHKVPFSRGGSTEIENLQVLCKAHNLWKGNSG